jgi:hypothetical protein
MVEMEAEAVREEAEVPVPCIVMGAMAESEATEEMERMVEMEVVSL